jgi:hypothetical protein
MQQAQDKKTKKSSRASMLLDDSLDLIPNKGLPKNVESWGYIRCNSLMVDKSLLLKNISFDMKGIIITRPRKWGKTINKSMIKLFYNCPLNAKTGKKDNAIFEFNKLLFTGGKFETC